MKILKFLIEVPFCAGAIYYGKIVAETYLHFAGAEASFFGLLIGWFVYKGIDACFGDKSK